VFAVLWRSAPVLGSASLPFIGGSSKVVDASAAIFRRCSRALALHAAP